MNTYRFAIMLGLCAAPVVGSTACGDSSAAPGDVDASTPEPTPSGDATTSTDAGADDATTATDAAPGDAGADGTQGDTGPDSGPSDSGTDSGPSDAGPPGTTTTMADLPGLTDFDFVGDHVVYRTPAFFHCVLPCATSNSLTTSTYSGGWSAGDDGRLHYLTPLGAAGAGFNAVSRLFDDSGGNSVSTTDGNFNQLFHSYHGGFTALAGIRFTPGLVGGGRFQFRLANVPGGTNTGRVARATRGSIITHSNVGGARAVYVPQQQPSSPPAAPVPPTFILAGGTVALPATAPSAIAVSAFGATVPYPAVAVVRGNHLEVCPFATPCATWIDLGVLGSNVAMDDANLYVGTPTGLARCTLAELGTLGTCTLATLGEAEPVDEPLYLTATHAWYRSGTRIRRVMK